jgi:hypothetical protein
MKFDKEKILKHKFWVMLLVVLPLSLSAIFILVTAVAGDINQSHEKIAKALKTFNSVKSRPMKTPPQLAEIEKEALIEKNKEEDVWEQNWEAQKPLLFWPKAMEEKFDFQDGIFAVKIQFLKGEVAAENTKNKITGEVVQQKSYYIVVRSVDKDKKAHEYKVYPAQKIDIEDKTAFGNIPKGKTVAVTFNRGKYFNELLTNAELTLYKHVDPDFNQDTYLSQILPIIEQVEPMNDKGEGVVQLPGYWYKKDALPPSYVTREQSFLNYLDKGWSEEVAGDISEEAWLAQEDLWMQSELFRLVRVANDYVSKFELVSASEKDKTYTFKNPYWELTLKWKNSGEVEPTLKNLLGRRQKLGVNFHISFDKEKVPETLSLSGPPLGPHGAPKNEDVKTFPAFKIAHKAKFSVEQVLTWETAAVKRIDLVTVGSQGYDDISQSFRTYPDGLDPLKPGDASVLAVAGLNPNPADQGRPGGVGGVGGFRSKAPGKQPKKKRDAGDNKMSKHGLIMNRYYLYLDPNLPPGTVPPPQQFRRIPVSIAMIVEQDHIDRVLTAFSNSKLRFVVTQVLLNRFPETLQPQLPKDGQPVAAAAGRGRQVTAPTAGNADSMETNYELVLYGMMTLYERFPAPVVP